MITGSTFDRYGYQLMTDYLGGTGHSQPKFPTLIPTKSMVNTTCKHMYYTCLRSNTIPTMHIQTLFSDEFSLFSDLHMCPHINYPRPIHSSEKTFSCPRKLPWFIVPSDLPTVIHCISIIYARYVSMLINTELYLVGMCANLC